MGLDSFMVLGITLLVGLYHVHFLGVRFAQRRGNLRRPSSTSSL
jgi:hypothetical protein